MTANDITTVIDHIAKKLEVPANKLMTLAPQLGVADFIGTSICFFIAILLIGITALGIHMMRKHDELIDGSPVSFALFLLLVITGIGAIFFIVETLARLPSTILWLYNPELWLLHKVVPF